MAGRREVVLPTPDITPVTHKRAVYEALKDMIVELVLPPGTRLVENDLAGQLNVSKTPVREAIATLEADGLVDVAAFRGATVSWLSRHQMTEHRFLIDQLELPALQLVVERITDEEIATIGAVVEALQEARATRRARDYRRLTSTVHEMTYSATRYPRLVKFITTLVGPIGLRYDRVFVDDFDDTWDLMLELSVRRHAAIARRDAAGATAAIVECRERITALNVSRIADAGIAPLFVDA